MEKVIKIFSLVTSNEKASNEKASNEKLSGSGSIIHKGISDEAKVIVLEQYPDHKFWNMEDASDYAKYEIAASILFERPSGDGFENLCFYFDIEREVCEVLFFVGNKESFKEEYKEILKRIEAPDFISEDLSKKEMRSVVSINIGQALFESVCKKVLEDENFVVIPKK